MTIFNKIIKMGKTNEDLSNPEQKSEVSSEQEKMGEVTKRSKQFVVLSGPSGSGKTMIIKHLVKKYGFVEPSFLTTRELRPGEQAIGGVQLNVDEFSQEEAKNMIFLPARNYGNAYGYDLDLIFNLVIGNNNIVVEAPVSNLTSEVRHFLPESTIIGILPPSTKELEDQLIQRGLNDDSDRKLRLQNAQAEKEQIISASKLMKIQQIIPIHGVPQYTISQIDKIMKEKGFNIKE